MTIMSECEVFPRDLINALKAMRLNGFHVGWSLQRNSDGHSMSLNVQWTTPGVPNVSTLQTTSPVTVITRKPPSTVRRDNARAREYQARKQTSNTTKVSFGQQTGHVNCEIDSMHTSPQTDPNTTSTCITQTVRTPSDAKSSCVQTDAVVSKIIATQTILRKTAECAVECDLKPEMSECAQQTNEIQCRPVSTQTTRRNTAECSTECNIKPSVIQRAQQTSKLQCAPISTQTDQAFRWGNTVRYPGGYNGRVVQVRYDDRGNRSYGVYFGENCRNPDLRHRVKDMGEDHLTFVRY